MNRSSRLAIAAFSVLLSFPVLVSADEVVLWDNYPDDQFLPPWDVSSERDTQRADDTWVVDDAVLEGGDQEFGIEISSFEWIAAIDPRASYDVADFILLSSTGLAPDPNSALVLSNLNYTVTPIDPDPDPSATRDLFRGRIDFDIPITVDPGHYYVGARLVDSSSGRAGSVVAAKGSEIRGQTGAFFMGPSFGLDQWTPVSTLFGTSDNFELAFRLNGFIVPEPASLVGLLFGSVFLLRRRR